MLSASPASPCRRSFPRLVLLSAAMLATPSVQAEPEQLPAAPTVIHNLGDCIRIAKEKSPILKAAAASLMAAQNGQEGINRASRFTHRIITPDIDIRKQQAANGITAAQAELTQADYDVTYNVIRTYYSAVYAREQIKVAGDLVTQLSVYLEFVKDAVKEGIRGITLNTQNQLEIYRGQAVSRQIEAQSGYERALKALAHEMSVGADYRFDVADRTLPEIKAEAITRDAVLGHALSRRGEITLATIGADVLRLEVSAQGAVRFRLRNFTAAAGADIHARSVPQGTREGEYRPDAIAPSFPIMIVGDRKARVATAEALSMRADAVLEKTRDLVTLEAENGYLRWEETARRVKELKAAAQAGRDLIGRSRKDADGKFTDEKQMQYEAISAQAIGSFNEALFQQLTALAALERITAGGVRVNFPGR